jgi:hypothetical protein
MKIRHRVGALCSALALATAGLVFTAPSAHAVTCGDVEADWTGLLASVWTTELYFDGVDHDTVVTLTNLGNTTVVLDLDTLTSYNGSYAHSSGVNALGYSATTPVLGNPFDRLTMLVEATSCNGDTVDAAAGIIVRQDVGTVGAAYMTRAL